jgi:hypothetical protein
MGGASRWTVLFKEYQMLRKTLFLTLAAVLVTLAMASKAQAWGCYHYSYHSNGYGGTSYHYGYHYGGYGGGSSYGYHYRY